MDTVSPNIFVDDINSTIAYYKLLGFQQTVTVPETEPYVFAMMVRGTITFMFQTFQSIAEDLPQVSRQNGGSLLLYIQIKDIRNFYEEIKDKVNVLKGLEKTFYGATEFSILDINNYVLTFAEDE